MQFSEEEAAEVKKWVVRKLEDISDADSDVLADFVLALIRSDAPDDEIRKASVENLEDFLREHTTKFVDELFETFGPKDQEVPSSTSHPQIQSQQPPPEIAQPVPIAPPHPSFPFNAPTGPARGAFGSPPMGGFAQSRGPYESPNFNRKRTYQDGFQADQDYQDAYHNRSFKTQRRGRGGRGDWMGRDGRTLGAAGQYPPLPTSGVPIMPPGFAPFDQNDPMAAMMALQGMGYPQMPGMPPMPIPQPTGAPAQQGAKLMQRCPFYDTQGICYLGATCPYQHGSEVMPSNDDEYDPKTSNVDMDIHRTDRALRGGDRGRGRGRGGGDRGGFRARGRAEFSALGPNDDQTITTIVVEQIPEEKFNEDAVREFFSQFGNILEVTLQGYRRLALVKYETYAAAKAAWSSPKVIFDNRFVKVYWYRPKEKAEKNGDQASGETAGDGTPFNREEFERQQEEAQKAYEEKMKKRKETEEAKEALDRQRDELHRKREEESSKLMQKLGGKPTSNGTGSTNGQGDTAGDGDTNEQTKQLRAQLESLEEEAKNLGLDPNSAAAGSSFSERGRGRGFPSYRGRGGFAPRGRGYDPSFRGGPAYRGRGAPRGRGASVLRLDNRPKRVAVSGVKINSEQDEALRQYLVGIGYESIEPNPEQPDSLIVSFKERFLAEKFMYGPRPIPSVGNVELSWVANPPPTAATTPASSSSPKPQPGLGDPTPPPTGDDEDTAMDSTAENPDPYLPSDTRKDGNGANDVDYDVAEVDDNWGG